jgi:heat shock protein HtpX
MDPTARHRLRNLLHAALLLGGMALLAMAVADLLIGPAAGVWALAGMVLALAVAPIAPKRLILSAYRARPLDPWAFPWGFETVSALASRADLPAVPQLWHVPSTVPNAFALGGPGDSAIVLTDGMLRGMTARELAGVLAHETAHISHRDLWIMAFADMTTRLVSVASLAGQVLLLLNLPLLLVGAAHVPWSAVLLLLFAPTVASLLQLALSRAREFDADLGAAQLTGDPAGLAQALAKLERRTGAFWEEILLPGRRIPEPSLLRTHPPTEERIARLMALAPSAPLALPRRHYTRPEWQPVAGPPRWRRAGLWW